MSRIFSLLILHEIEEIAFGRLSLTQSSSEGKDGDSGEQGEGHGAENLGVIDRNRTTEIRVEADVEVSQSPLHLSLVQESLSGIGRGRLGGLLDSSDGQVEVSFVRVALLLDLGREFGLAFTFGDDAARALVSGEEAARPVDTAGAVVRIVKVLVEVP